jgi:hypothetical protein
MASEVARPGAADEAFDPARVSDPLWFRDDDRGAYVPLDLSLYADIAAGKKRL